MNVVISCDELVQRTHVTEIVELFSELYPHSEIYTLAHKVNAIHGKLEMRKIHSSFLTHKVSSKEDLKKLTYTVPGAAKNLFISCSVDLIINISSGLSHGILKCDSTKMITYLYSDEYISEKPKGFIQKFFRKFLKNWSLQQLKNADKVYFSSSRLQELYQDYCKDSAVLEPSFKLNDFKLFPKDMFAHDYILINAYSLDEKQAHRLESFLKDLNLKFRFVGPDEHLSNLKAKSPELFLGQKCVGEMAPIYAGSAFYMDFTNNEFPFAPLACLATGRPVMVSDSPSAHDFLKGDGVKFVNPDNTEEVKKIITEMLEHSEELEGAKLRATTNKYNEIRFKSKFKKEIESLMAN